MDTNGDRDFDAIELTLTNVYRARLIALRLIQNAPDAGIKQEELHRTIDMIARAERMDKEIILDAVIKEIKMME